LQRRRFLGVSAAALAGTQFIRGGSAARADDAEGEDFADLRWGKLALPPSTPGYDPAGDAKTLIAATVASPAPNPIPGVQLLGSYAPGQRFVLRVPSNWNGRLVVAGTPAFRSEFANDAIWGDFVMTRGYAFASSNKGIAFSSGIEKIAASDSPGSIYPIPFDLFSLESEKIAIRLGALTPAKTSLAAWNDDLVTLIKVAKQYLVAHRHLPSHVYAVGYSNGGSQVRSLLERHPDLVDGGVDWSGVYWSPQRSLLDYLPPFLKAMPAYVASGFNDAQAAAAIEAAGFPTDRKQSTDGHQSLWFEYYAGQPSFYADLTLFAYALLIDPEATASIAAGGCTPDAKNPAGLPGTCAGTGLATPGARAAYVPSQAARNAIRGFAHSGDIGRPLLSIAGSADAFVTPHNNATAYLAAIKRAGKGNLCIQYLVDGGTHVDPLVDFGYGLRAQAPFAWAAFDQLAAVVERGVQAPGAGTQRIVTAPTDIVSR
jgi:pimeloyl-ACP methyl ester carboxylesterase